MKNIVIVVQKVSATFVRFVEQYIFYVMVVFYYFNSILRFFRGIFDGCDGNSVYSKSHNI
jgi:hypothetical protein